jgi:hypothetical protein
MRGWVPALVCASGCFSIPTFRGSPDAAIDAPTHDEDQDGIPDYMDTCPVLPGHIDDPDSDGDGVGDACDPDNNKDDPDTGELFAFATLHEAGLGGGQLMAGDEPDTIKLLGLMPLFTLDTFADARVEVRFEVLASDPTTGALGLLVSHPVIGGADAGLACRVGITSGSAIIVDALSDAQPVSSRTYPDPTFAVGLKGRFVGSHYGTTFGCDASELVPMGAQSVLGFDDSGTPFPQTGGNVGVVVNTATIQLEYIYVVGKKR